MNRTNAIVMSQKTMGEILGYSRATLSRGVALLKKEKWCQIVSMGSTNAYVLNSKVLWRDHGGKRYSSFYAEVIASESEQSQPLEQWDNLELRQVPVIQQNEFPLEGDEELPPPDQRDLLPLDRAELPRSKGGRDHEAIEQ